MSAPSILIAGRRAFAAQGLADLLRARGADVAEISCGGEVPQRHFDCTICFAIPRTGTPADAARELARLFDECRRRGVRRWLQISSLAVYPPSAAEINPSSPILRDSTSGEGYAARKRAQDAWLEDSADGVELSFFRPGVLYARDGETHTGGIGVRLCKGLGILLGDARTGLSICSREAFHLSLADAALASEPPPKVVLLGENTTKLAFAKRFLGGGVWIPLPRRTTCLAAKVLLGGARAKRVAGLFARPTVNPGGK